MTLRFPAPILALISVGFISASLAGCGSAPSATFDLSVPAAASPRGIKIGPLAVAEPTGLQIFETDRIIVRNAGGSISAVPDAQWADRLPRLLQTKIVQSLQNVSSAGLVSRVGERAAPARVLMIETRAFQIEPETGAVRIELSAKIVDDVSGRALRARIFTASAPIATIDGPNATQSFDRALAILLEDMTRWIAGGR